jgi:hypothetical protein
VESTVQDQFRFSLWHRRLTCPLLINAHTFLGFPGDSGVCVHDHRLGIASAGGIEVRVNTGIGLKPVLVDDG